MKYVESWLPPGLTSIVAVVSGPPVRRCLTSLYDVVEDECWTHCLVLRVSSVQDGIIYICTQKSPYIMQSNPSLRIFLMSPLKQFNNHLIDDGPLSSFERRYFSASSFHASLLQAIDGVMSLALCPQVVSQAPQYFRSFEKKDTCES